MCCLQHFWLMPDNALIQEEAQEYTHEDSIGLCCLVLSFSVRQTQKVTFSLDEKALSVKVHVQSSNGTA